MEADEGSPATFAVAKKGITDVITQLRRERQIFLAPLNIYSGVSIAFIVLDYAEVSYFCSSSSSEQMNDILKYSTTLNTFSYKLLN